MNTYKAYISPLQGSEIPADPISQGALPCAKTCLPTGRYSALSGLQKRQTMKNLTITFLMI
jgi:hypothetical protein